MPMMRLTAAVAIVLASAGVALAAEAPAGAAACSGCHASSTRVETPVPPLNGRPAADIASQMIAFKAGQRPGDHHGPHRQGILRRRDPGDRRLVRSRKSKGRSMAIHKSRRDFLKAASAAALFPMPALAQGARAKGRRYRRRLRGRVGGALREESQSGNRRDAGRGEPDVHRLPVFQRRDRRVCVTLSAQQFNYQKLGDAGITLAIQAAAGVDAQAKSVTLERRIDASL